MTLSRNFISSKHSLLTLLGVGVVAVSAVGIAYFQLFVKGPLAPNTSQSLPKAAEVANPNACTLVFDVNAPIPSPTPCIHVDKSASPVCTNAGSGANITLSYNVTCPQAIVPQPLDIAFVLDTSCSMDNAGGSPPQPISDAKNAAKQLFNYLDPNYDQVDLITFGTSPVLRSGFTNEFDTLKSTIDALPLTCGTGTGNAIKKAQEQLQQNGRSNALKVIVVFSDGMADVDGNGNTCSGAATAETTCTRFAIEQASLAKEQGTTIYSIALKNAVSNATWNQIEITMKAIASSLETYYAAPTSQDLATIFDDISKIISTYVASSTVIHDVLPPNVSLIPGSAVPAISSQDGQNITWNLGSLSSGHTSSVSFQVNFTSIQNPQLVDAYPDSHISYTDLHGNNLISVFPYTQVVPLVCVQAPSPTILPVEIPTDTPSPTASSIATSTPTATTTFTITSSPTVTPSATFTQTPTQTATATFTNTPSVTPTVTLTATVTQSLTPTFTATSTFTRTPTPSATYTTTLTQNPSNTPPLTITASSTPTHTPSTTFTATQTQTPTPVGLPKAGTTGPTTLLLVLGLFVIIIGVLGILLIV